MFRPPDTANVLSFQAGEGLAWQCSYDTSADSSKVCFGESGQTNEMCFIWAYYYPSHGAHVCLHSEAHGVSDRCIR